MINKIVYFDKETIKNILQEKNKGVKKITTESKDQLNTKLSTEIEVETRIKMEVPFWARVKFLFSAKLNSNYISNYDKTISITSTEISEFEKIKKHFKKIENITLSDIENSSTFIRVAGGYLKMMKDGVEGVDSREFKKVMDSYEGYDNYKINTDEKTYLRFNNSAFVSNYKRNDLLNSRLTIYCLLVGEFDKENFDFIKQIEKMQHLISSVETPKTISEIFNSSNIEKNDTIESFGDEKIKLYDVVYASVCYEENV